MDSERFDALTRLLGQGITRRGETTPSPPGPSRRGGKAANGGVDCFLAASICGIVTKTECGSCAGPV